MVFVLNKVDILHGNPEQIKANKAKLIQLLKERSKEILTNVTPLVFPLSAYQVS